MARNVGEVVSIQMVDASGRINSAAPSVLPGPDESIMRAILHDARFAV